MSNEPGRLGHHEWRNTPGLPLPKAAALLMKKIRDKNAEVAVLEKELEKVRKLIKGEKPKKKKKKRSGPPHWAEKT